MGKIGLEGSAMSGKLDRPLELCDCSIVKLLLDECLAQFKMPDGKVRVHFQCFLTLLDRVGARMDCDPSLHLDSFSHLLRTETGIPRLVIRLSTLHPTFASVR